MKPEFEYILKKNGFSLTSTRTRVFDVLNSADSPLLPLEVYKKTSGVNLSSIYRSLEVFEKVGIATRVSSGFKTKYQLGEIFRPHKHHLTCSQCGRSAELPEARIEDLILELSGDIGFRPSGHVFEITGRCNKC